jgi:hypothetical protein
MIMNPLKDLLKPKYVVGLQVKEGFIGAVQLYVGLKGPEIDKAVFIEVADPERLREELMRLFQEQGFKKEMIVTSIPSSKAFIREISLPLSQPKKIEKIIKYQMEPYLPCPVEEVLVDFLQPGEDGSILTFGVEKKFVAEHLALLAGAGIEPDAVTLDDIGLFSLYLYKHGSESEHPIAIVNQDGQSLVVQIIHQKRLDFIRIVPDNVDQLEDTFRFYKMNGRTSGEIPRRQRVLRAGEKREALESKTAIKTMVAAFDEMRDRLDRPSRCCTAEIRSAPRARHRRDLSAREIPGAEARGVRPKNLFEPPEDVSFHGRWTSSSGHASYRERLSESVLPGKAVREAAGSDPANIH